MTPSTEIPKIVIPLSSAAHDAAEEAYQQQAPRDRQQTYLNVLAVQAVQQYLQWLSIPTDWHSSDSQDPVMRRFLNVADLTVPGYGRLECRPVLPGADHLEIPSEVRDAPEGPVSDHRLGYIAVQFDPDLETATLLGFAPTAGNGTVPLSDLEPMAALMDVVGSATAATVQTTEVPDTLLNWQEPIQLGQWLSRKVSETATELVTAGWQILEELETVLAPEARMELAFSMRSARGGAAEAIPVARRGKRLTLGEGQESVALVVGLSLNDPPETDVSVEIYPAGQQSHLPEGLELVVLDESGEAVMQAQAQNNRKIQLDFSGEAGEPFSLQLSLGTFSITEAFVL